MLFTAQVPATALQLAAKDLEVQELQEQNAQLRQQVAEYEKAMHMASEYHAAAQAAHQVRCNRCYVQYVMRQAVAGYHAQGLPWPEAVEFA
jgi:septal ring factor EnvC (AmiA/AmiB activator)